VSRRSRRRAAKRRQVYEDRQPHSAASMHADPAQDQILDEEYRYVLADLRRIGVLATIMVALLIALSFLLK
jgi:hypothetical protein